MSTDFMQWFETLTKPEWGGDFSWLGDIWIAAYPMAILAFGIIGYLVWSNTLSIRILVPIAVNVFFSLGFGVFMVVLPSLFVVGSLMLIYALTIAWILGELVQAGCWKVILVFIPYIGWLVTGIVVVLELMRLNGI